MWRFFKGTGWNMMNGICGNVSCVLSGRNRVPGVNQTLACLANFQGRFATGNRRWSSVVKNVMDSI